VIAVAEAPGKVILFGEHAINRGQPALAVAVGIHARCTVTTTRAPSIRFSSGEFRAETTREEIAAFARMADDWRTSEDFGAIRAAVAADFFAPAKYVLSRMLQGMPEGLSIRWESEIPPQSGLGSGGAAFVTLVCAVAEHCPRRPSIRACASAAHRGDILAHGGTASALDTSASLSGGVIGYLDASPAFRQPCAKGFTLVIGDTGVKAATSEVNGRVRAWLEADPDSRMHVFRTVGALTRAAAPCLERGDWDELGRLLNLNQLMLEKIGVSCPELDCLIAAALSAGALGAKVSGSGGGGIMIALATPETRDCVAEAITAAGGTAYLPEVGVPGVCVQTA
jgi:mevalonate kinase